MELLRFYVDLRSYPLEQRLSLTDKLEQNAFIVHPFLDEIGLFEVFWDIPTPISKILEIPESLVTTALNKN